MINSIIIKLFFLYLFKLHLEDSSIKKCSQILIVNINNYEY